MTPKDIFFGPILRRAQPDLVVVCLASHVPLELCFSVREHPKGAWLAHDDAPFTVKVSENLYFYFGCVRPPNALRTGVLLAYGIGVKTAGGVDYAPFEAIVKEDGLAYADAPLPTFVLQAGGAPLNVLYGSCRKIHDTKGGKFDTLAAGDAQVASTFLDPSKRPTILCLGGDQIYADDVQDLVAREIASLSRRIEGAAPEQLPDAGRLGANREVVLRRNAKFTSDDLKNHVVRFSEYLALYGLMWNGRNWTRSYRELDHFTKTLPAVRRLMANVPTYMIFDDHDVTDDWNLDLRWYETVWRAPLGRRIVANALMAYWLCQGWGNDPDGFGAQASRELATLIEKRATRYADVDKRFWSIDGWEFSTPTSPFVYFLDTRTQRGARDDPAAHEPKAPAFLKSVKSWEATVKRLSALLSRQGGSTPFLLVSAAPVFGFKWVEGLQAFVTDLFGAYKFDYENWAANDAHFALFLKLLAGRNVVVLSGDVHYGFSSTVRYTEFDSLDSRAGGVRARPTGRLPALPGGAVPSYRPTTNAQFIQLCSSAINNYAGGLFTSIPAWFSRTEPGTIRTDDGKTLHGRLERDVFIMLEPDPDRPDARKFVIRAPSFVKPVTMFHQRINDAYNSAYIGEHNLGLVSVRGMSVEHRYLMGKSPQSERRWDFSNPRYWE
ncbi:MAG: hypothetical protein ABWZ88_10935 [Variovorax sp.]